MRVCVRYSYYEREFSGVVFISNYLMHSLNVTYTFLKCTCWIRKHNFEIIFDHKTNSPHKLCVIHCASLSLLSAFSCRSLWFGVCFLCCNLFIHCCCTYCCIRCHISRLAASPILRCSVPASSRQSCYQLIWN